ncbi:GlxA family transcriptional regulator [Thiofilum flexile]|uniref:GlxA family transcriptional regulator n=1 Tax=Thiofilum flexile TaxID=125627 RepID=UPI00036785A5|nr:helix-turn-helix domain-containing protein [Thiofilum flexile]
MSETIHIQKTLDIALLAYDQANAVDVFGPLQVFASASTILLERLKLRTEPAYRTRVLSIDSTEVRLATGTRIHCDGLLTDLGTELPDTLLIVGGDPAPQLAQNIELITHLGQLLPDLPRVGSVCSGAFLLAATGCLNGRRATTHWRRYELFRERFPQVELMIDAIHTEDDHYHCSAGVTAGMDLALRLVEDDFGRKVALETAREMVMFYHRPGGQSQYSNLTGLKPAATPALQKVQDWISTHLSQNLEVGILAEQAAMSTRHFSRKFQQEIGLSPARYVTLARLHQARLQLESSPQTLKSIARQCGYPDAEIMRRAFIRELNVSPTEYRQRFCLYS